MYDNSIHGLSSKRWNSRSITASIHGLEKHSQPWHGRTAVWKKRKDEPMPAKRPRGLRKGSLSSCVVRPGPGLAR
eukprot:1141213-Pelagomonas_calceolata.AAC.2